MIDTSDILRPELFWIDDRCYRIQNVNVAGVDLGGAHHSIPKYLEEHDDEPQCTASWPTRDDQESDDEFTIVDKAGSSEGSVIVATAYMGCIIGKGGDTKRRLMDETNTKIFVPPRNPSADSERVIVTGASKRDVASCLRRIKLLVDSARGRQTATHFLGLPFNGEQMKQRFQEFTRAVLETCENCSGISERIFQRPEKLHLTIGVLPLLSKAERQEAVEQLNACEQQLIRKCVAKEGGLKIRVCGLDIMNDDPGAVDVLYACVKLEDSSQLIEWTLQEFVDSMAVDYFVSKGLMQKMRWDRVKLHMTLINTRYGSELWTEENQGKGARRETFDARKLLDEFQDFDFGVHTVDRVCLSQRFATDTDGYYYTLHSVPI